MKTAGNNPSARPRGARPRLFISYRRRFDAASARLLKDALTRAFGEGAVFRDVDDIEPGEAFPDSIREAVDSCDAFLPLISPGWLESAARLHEPDDFVRREIAGALARGVPLIPVLLGDARMPKADDLPEEIRALAFRNAIELSDGRWNYDVERLVKLIRARTARTGPHSPAAGVAAALRPFLGTWPGRAAAAAAVLLALFAAAFFADRYGLFGRDFESCVRRRTPDMPGGAATLRSGVNNSAVLTADRYEVIRGRGDEPGGVPLMLRLSDEGAEVGAVLLRFNRSERAEGSVFRVERVLAPACADVQDFFNADRPAADKHILNNWDRLGLRLGGRDYVVRTGDHGDYIVATLAPAPADLQTPWK